MERRSFFRLVGLSAVVAAGASLTSCSEDTQIAKTANTNGATVSNNPEVSFSVTTDVLIVGSGISGMSAAMAPIEQGFSVTIAEKSDLLGGESYTSDGVFRLTGSKIQKEAKCTEQAEAYWEVYGRKYKDSGLTNEALAQKLCSLAPEWLDHCVDEYGAQFADPSLHIKEGGLTSVVVPRNGLGDMESVMMPMRDALSQKGVTFMTGHKAESFIENGEGVICGIRLRDMKQGKVVDVSCPRIVIATGGYNSNQQLVAEHAEAQTSAGCITTLSMGEGLDLATSVNGALGDMDLYCGMIGDIHQASWWGMFAPMIAVDALGNRFTDEVDESNMAWNCWKEERGYWWSVFGPEMANCSQASSVAAVLAERKTRVVGPCDDVKKLSQETGMPLATLKATIDRHNSMARRRNDEDFGKTFMLKEVKPPFYALKQFPVRFTTHGGVVVDEDGRLQTDTATAVQGVFCCGAVAAGSPEGLSTNGAFGLMVGRVIADELEEMAKKKKG